MHSDALQPEATESTYPIDPEQAAELARLMQQDRLVTEAMGGLFPEGEMLPRGGRVLDLACGPGGWAMQVALQYPDSQVTGIDLNVGVIDFARIQAHSRGLSNVEFAVMDIMQPLAFADASFDLINGRFLFSFMRPAAWPLLLAECRRLLKPGGVIRLIETEGPLTTSEATERLFALGYAALKRAGQSFSPDGNHIGITPVLARLLRRAGFTGVGLRASVAEWSSDTPLHYAFFKDELVALALSLPFLVKMGMGTEEELRRLHQQAVAEMQADDFCAIWTWLTVWGRQPG